MGETTAASTRHFPRKGERFINGEWVPPEVPTPAEAIASKHNAVMDATFEPIKSTTAFDRRNYLRKKAGWPPLKMKEKTNG